MKIVIEIPDVLDPAQADAQFASPLARLLEERRLGNVVAVGQGEPNSPQSFCRVITLEVVDEASAMDALQSFLGGLSPPLGTTVVSYDADGREHEIFMLGLGEDD